MHTICVNLDFGITSYRGCPGRSSPAQDLLNMFLPLFDPSQRSVQLQYPAWWIRIPSAPTSARRVALQGSDPIPVQTL